MLYFFCFFHIWRYHKHNKRNLKWLVSLRNPSSHESTLQNYGCQRTKKRKKNRTLNKITFEIILCMNTKWENIINQIFVDRPTGGNSNRFDIKNGRNPPDICMKANFSTFEAHSSDVVMVTVFFFILKKYINLGAVPILCNSSSSHAATTNKWKKENNQSRSCSCWF